MRERKSDGKTERDAEEEHDSEHTLGQVHKTATAQRSRRRHCRWRWRMYRRRCRCLSDSRMKVRDAWWSYAPPRQQHDDGGAHSHSIDRHQTALQCRHRCVHQHSRACSLPAHVVVCAEMRITVTRIACIAPHVASQASSIFGVATRRCVATIVSSLEPSVSHDIMICDGYIACSATTWTGYLLAPQVGVADGFATLVANATYQVVRLRLRRRDLRL
jgi:hypothetical protein